MYACVAQADCFENKTKDGLRRKSVRRELKKRGRGMKDRVDRMELVYYESIKRELKTRPINECLR